MKNRAALVLMEQLVVILVFTLGVSFCLLAFSHAHRLSRETIRQDRATELAITGCEVVKAHTGNLEKAAETLGGRLEADQLLVDRDDLIIEIRILNPKTPHLGQAEVRILEKDTNEPLYSLTVSWQEVAK